MKRKLMLVLRYSGIPFLIRTMVQGNRTTILYYHDIQPELFDRHLDYLKKHYNIISLQDYLANRREQAKRKLIITFDDGHKGNAALLPVLEKHQVPITIFLVSGLIGTTKRFWFKLDSLTLSEKLHLKTLSNSERMAFLENGHEPDLETGHEHALSRADVASLRKWVDFQSHTVTHPCLNQCSDEESWFELDTSRRQLEGLLESPVVSLAFPNGDFTPREVELSKKAGYSCVLSTNVGFNAPRFNGNYVLNRISINDKSPINELVVRACGLWGWLKGGSSKF